MYADYQRVLDSLQINATIIKTEVVNGGCINKTTLLETTRGPFFLKENTVQHEELFRKEVLGLIILSEKSKIRVPEVIGSTTIQNRTFLLLEWIQKGPPSKTFWQDFGSQLAHQHKQSQELFGLAHDNHIGRLKQSNSTHSSWSDFFVLERLLPQIELAEANNLLDYDLRHQFESLFNRISQLVPDEAPSLLHGDLWSGNFMCDIKSRPCIFDPAVYYGHRETELAFTYLFGGFDPIFHQSYHQEFPLLPEFNQRVEVHNLYPLLVHVNLFGTSYLSGIRQTLNRFS